MDFNFKKAAAGASSFLSRAKQLTEEKLGGAEKTEYDANFEQLLKNADHTRALTERIISNCEALLQPNPNERLEDFLLTKLDKKTSKPNNLEIYGYCMVEAGSEIGFNSQYGNVLVKVGEAEKKLGFAEKEYVQKATDSFLQPLKSFLDGQMKIIQKEKKSLETKRIDLDICKSKMKRHKDGKADDEEELRKAQTEFDRQLELTKLLLDELHVTHNHHLRCLSDFVDAQLTYHNKSVKILQDLQKQIGGITMQFNSNKITINNNVNTNNNITNPNFNYNNNNNNSKLNSITANTTNLSINSNDNNNNNNKNNLKKAKVLFDYEASEPSELSVFANEIVYVEISAEDNDWVCAKRDNNLNNNNVLNDTYCGKIPKAYIQIVE